MEEEVVDKCKLVRERKGHRKSGGCGGSKALTSVVRGVWGGRGYERTGRRKSWTTAISAPSGVTVLAVIFIFFFYFFFSNYFLIGVAGQDKVKPRMFQWSFPAATLTVHMKCRAMKEQGGMGCLLEGGHYLNEAMIDLASARQWTPDSISFN